MMESFGEIKMNTDDSSASEVTDDTNNLARNTGLNSITNEDMSSLGIDVAANSLVEKMLARIANSDAHFKHQQRGEPDLSHEEKLKIAKDILDSKPATFLSRFGKYMVEEDLPYFEQMKADYTIDFYLKDIRKNFKDQKDHKKTRNRRYEAMKQMMSDGDYFDDEQMKSRDPLLYEQMIGKHLTEDEIQSSVDKTDLRFSNILLNHIQVQQNNDLYQVQKDVEEGQMEESDDDEEEEEEEEESEMEEDAEEKLSEPERKLLRNEFVRTMQLRFLNGEDKDFDYSEVDGNVEYDSIDIRQQDEEEKYFDEEDEQSIHSEASSGTTGSCKMKTEKDDEEDYENFQISDKQEIHKQNDKDSSHHIDISVDT